MTLLQKEMLEAFEDLAGDHGDMAIASAEVAKRYIEKALGELNGKCYTADGNGFEGGIFNRWKDKWLKENGIIE